MRTKGHDALAAAALSLTIVFKNPSIYFIKVSLSKINDSGRCPEELLNPAEYMSYQRICNMEHVPESQPAAAFPPVTFLPQHPYAQQPASEPMYSNTGFSAPGPRAPFTFPKEQSV
ncbi:putative poliovirus receptor-related protein 1-like [Scophthalmus maximus]|uniref:Putative poliovirus receptor-related protein 1-like n=1 Tax=Scophthalmus maximus TaxID=52904 RepID=A0A2U9B3Z4_SCOMX|nr:putative poliovirus receptor-related protein 1-like [Scophthalmus maximus]